jgi:hypothetical protein
MDGCRNNSESCSGSSGHAGGTRSGQTRKEPKDPSVREREERGCLVTVEHLLWQTNYRRNFFYY